MRRLILALLSVTILSGTLLTAQVGAAPSAPAAEAGDAPGWIVDPEGIVQPVGGAANFGDLGSITLNSPIVGIGPTPFGEGYWLVAADGGLFAFGDAGFFGSMGGVKLNSPVVAMASTETGEGYWMVAADGGLFAFGDAGFFGSMGGTELNSPIVAIASTPTGEGYWMVAADGGLFSFGDAGFYGSMGQTTLNSPVVGIAPAADGEGYWLVGADGGIFSFGSTEYFGSTALEGIEVFGLAPTPSGDGYQVFSSDGRIFGFGSAPSNPNKSDLGSVTGVAPRPTRKRGDNDGKGGGSGVTTTTRPEATTTTRAEATTTTTRPESTTTTSPSTTTTTSASGDYPTDINDPILEAERDAAALAACREAKAAMDGTAEEEETACQEAAKAAWKAKKAEQQALIDAGGDSATTTTTAPSTTTTTTAPSTTTTTTAPSTTTTTTAPSTTTTTTAPSTTTTTTGPTTTTVGNTSMTYPSAGSTPQERAYNALGIYKGGSKGSNFVNHELWMGRKTNYWLTWLSGDFDSTLSAIRSGINSTDSKFFQDERTLILSMNLTARDGHYEDEDATQQLTDAKNGVNDWYWEELGRLMVEKGMTGYWPDGRPKVILRIAWEHNGDWYPWSARPGRNELFRDAYRRAVLTLESTAGEVTTVWGSSTLQNTAVDLNASYPGDDVVDIIEVDVYDAYGAYVPNPYGEEPNIARREATWLKKLNGSNNGTTGLQFFADFAKEHNKGFAIGEFGVFQLVKNGQEIGGGDNPEWIQHIFDFAGAQENLVYVNYFEVNRSGSKHRLSPTGYSDGVGGVNGSVFPIAATKFLELWGNN